MTMIRIKKYRQDYITSDPNHDIERRNFLAKTVKGAAVTLLLPKVLGASLINSAMADAPTCPTSAQVKGGLMHIFAEGGATMTSRFISPAQAGIMNATIATSYGINQDLVDFGGNGWKVSASNAYGQLLVPPVGISAQIWADILKNVSVTGNFGAFNADDGGGDNLGQIAGSAGLKPGVIPSDILVNVSSARATWAKGLSAVRVGTPTGASLSGAFNAPKGAGTDPRIWGNTVSAMGSLSQAFAGLFGSGTRNGAEKYVARGLCGAQAAANQTDPSYGLTLFSDIVDPTKAAKVPGVDLNQLSPEERGFLSAAYRTADGTVPGVMVQFGGRDYHTQDPATVVAPADYKEAQAIKMWLLGAYLAKAPSALIYNSNGHCSSPGGTVASTVNTTLTDGSTRAVALSNNKSDGSDNGGRINAGFLLCYNPNGSGPLMRQTGVFDSGGGVKALAALSSVPNAIASLHLSALKFLGNDVNKAYGLMQANGVNAKLSDLILLT
jgi:hypothetical protein